MTTKSKNKDNKMDVEHCSSLIHIKDAIVCSKCPLKLYAKKNDTIVFGTGNINTDTIMILPSYDVKAKIGYNTILNIVRKVYQHIKGTELLEDYYVTRSVKCVNKTDFNLEKDAIKHCITNLFYEISRINPKKLIIFDKHLYDFGLYRCNQGKFIVKTCVSPAVMYYDNQNLKDIFIKQLTEALNES